LLFGTHDFGGTTPPSRPASNKHAYFTVLQIVESAFRTSVPDNSKAVVLLICLSWTLHAGCSSKCESRKRTYYKAHSRLKDQYDLIVSVVLAPPQLDHLANFSCSFLLCFGEDVITPKVYVGLSTHKYFPLHAC